MYLLNNTLYTAAEQFYDEETLSYVLRPIIKRLECEECAGGIGILLDKDSATGFAVEMLFERGLL